MVMDTAGMLNIGHILHMPEMGKGEPNMTISEVLTLLCIVAVLWLIAGLVIGLILGPKLREIAKNYPEVKTRDEQ